MMAVVLMAVLGESNSYRVVDDRDPALLSAGLVRGHLPCVAGVKDDGLRRKINHALSKLRTDKAQKQRPCPFNY